MTRRDVDDSAEARNSDREDRSSSVARRRFLRCVPVAGVAALAGCQGGGNDAQNGSGDNGSTTEGSGGTTVASGRNGTNGTAANATSANQSAANGSAEFVGSGSRDPAALGGISMTEMPALSGTLQVYSGRGEALVGELVEYIRNLYPDFTLEIRYQGSTELANQILTEGQSSPADVFFSVNAGSLGLLAEEGRTQQLPQNVLSKVPQQFRDPAGNWVGISGRARSIPYNTNAFDSSAIPTDIFAFPEQSKFEGVMGWAPTYGSFQAFVTAMRVLNGEQQTKQWLQGMQDQGIESYSDEFLIAQAVADGEIEAGFTNHYYIQRVLAARSDAPLATAFTTNDAGSVFNVAGAAVLDTAANTELAANFVRHLLSSEAQDYFARTTKEYPLVPAVAPVGALPRINDLNPPGDLDLTQLSNLEPTIELMREVGLDV
ncbi:extracellular solute-binding protein [Halococcus agarilyticus]|uniref:extracellular solute-binding protein n=1 Tax=Halococcus agarilyticus TaxID=1232219 RepID=UPI0006782A73|nr:extracellular solute-binding protein [Halococcus agarilyticus]